VKIIVFGATGGTGQSLVEQALAAGHEVTVFAASVPGRPNEEMVDGYRVVRRGGRLTVYRAARGS
jgi:uncharacterized protein YbjT (DUF2867 family)